MTRPWQVLASADTAEGRLELRWRGGSEHVITLAGRVLMNGAAHRTEEALAELACRRIAGRPLPRVLIGGLGLGYSLRAALAALPERATVIVAEIEPVIVEWCRGPLAKLVGGALADPRVSVEIADVAERIARAGAAAGPRRLGEETAGRRRAGAGRAGEAGPGPGAAGGRPAGGAFDAILLDLYEGPRTAAQGRDDPLWGRVALARARAALAPGGVLAVWSEDPDAGFETRLAAAGFTWQRHRPGPGGPRHVVYLATREPALPRSRS